MFDIGWSELLLIGVAALIVIGPEDLPRMFRALGRITARARQMAREFSMAMEDAARTSGLDDAAGTLRDVKSLTSSRALGLDALDRAAEKFEKWDPKLPVRGAGLTPDPAQPAHAVQPAPSVQPALSQPASAPAPAGESDPLPTLPDAAPPSVDQRPRRQLHAVRRSAGSGPAVHPEDR